MDSDRNVSTGNTGEDVTATPSPSSGQLTSVPSINRQNKRPRTQRRRNLRPNKKPSSSNSADSKKSTGPPRSKKQRRADKNLSRHEFYGFAFDHTRYPVVELTRIDLRDYPSTSDGRYIIGDPIVKLIRIDPYGLPNNTTGLYRVRNKGIEVPRKPCNIPALTIKDEPAKEQIATKKDDLKTVPKQKKALFTPKTSSENLLEVIEPKKSEEAEGSKEQIKMPETPSKKKSTKHLDKQTFDEMLKMISPDRSSSAFATYKFKSGSKQSLDKKSHRTTTKSSSLFDLSSVFAKAGTSQDTKKKQTSQETLTDDQKRRLSQSSDKKCKSDVKSSTWDDDDACVESDSNVTQSTIWPASDDSIIERLKLRASAAPFVPSSSNIQSAEETPYYDSEDLCFSPVSPLPTDCYYDETKASKSVSVQPKFSPEVDTQFTDKAADYDQKEDKSMSPETCETIEKVTEQFMSESFSISSTPEFYVKKEVLIQNFTLVLDKHLEDIKNDVRPTYPSPKVWEYDIEMLARFTPLRVVTKEEAFLPIKVDVKDIEPCDTCACGYIGRSLKRRFIVDALLEINLESKPRLPERKLFDLARALSNL